MLSRTHLAITLFFVLLFLGVVEYKISFVLTALIATLIPDIDSKFSKAGNYKFLRFFQFFIKHRSMTHSFIFLILITFFLILFFPIISLGFFLGYGLHLLADSFTLTGIVFFYPFKKKSCWKIHTGGRSETTIFVFFVLGNIGLLMWRIFSWY